MHKIKTGVTEVIKNLHDSHMSSWSLLTAAWCVLG